MPLILGITDGDKIIPVRINDDGQLEIDVKLLETGGVELNLDSAGDVQVDVKSGVLIASELNLDGEKDLQVDVKTIASGTNLIGRVDARSGDKIWSFNKVIGQNLGLASIPTVDYNATGSAVPPGWIYRVTLLTFYYAGALTPFCFAYPLGTPHTCIPFKQDPMVDDQWYPVITDIILEAGDYIVGRIEEAAINDTFYFRYGGYGFQV